MSPSIRVLTVSLTSLVCMGAAAQRPAQPSQPAAVIESDGTTPLHRAVERGDLATVDALIRQGTDVKSATRYGVTPLSLAASNSHTAIIQRLLTAGADPNTALPEGETVLMTASATGNVAAVKLLLAQGANVNTVENWKGQTALMWAAAGNHAAVVRQLISAGADFRAASKSKFTPFLFAVREGAIDVVRLLLEVGVSANEKASDDTSALVLATINAHYEVAVLLLEHGADPNVPDARGSALHALAWIRRPGTTASGSVPPQPTGKLDSLDLVKALLRRGANPNVRLEWNDIPFDRDDGEAKIPPNLAVGRDFISLVGATPFFLAAKHGDVQLMRALVDGGADPLLKTKYNVTPLMAAAGLGYWTGESPGPMNGNTSERERLEALKLTIDLGGDIHAVADYGDFPIEGDGLELLYSYPKNLEQLPPMGDIRWSGSTALHGAALAGEQPSIIRFLVEKGARLDARNKIGWTPLMITEGCVCGASVKYDPGAAALFRQLMVERGMDPSLYSQKKSTSAALQPKP